MISVLHGDDTAASYARLSQIIEKYKNHLKVNLSKPQESQILEAVLTTDLISQDKIIIVENFLPPLKKLPQKLFSAVGEDKVLVFWEKTTLSPAKVKALSKFAQLEHFKQTTDLFSFLDNIVPGSKNALVYISNLEEDGLLWQIQNRFLLLLLCRHNLPLDQIIKVTKRNVAPWQLDKLKQQARRFDPKQLLATYQGSLKVDFLIKSGKTNLGAKTLISVLLLKYL